jgi:hypothetical protein
MRQASNLTGVVALLARTGAFVVGDSFMKVVTSELPPFEVLLSAPPRLRMAASYPPSTAIRFDEAQASGLGLDVIWRIQAAVSTLLMQADFLGPNRGAE